MIILQALIDSALSANWFYGIILAVVAFFLVRYIKKVDHLLDTYGKDIQVLKTGHEIQEHRIDRLETVTGKEAA